MAVAVDIMAETQLGKTLKREQTAPVAAVLESLSGTVPEISLPVLPGETAATPRPTSDMRQPPVGGGGALSYRNSGGRRPGQSVAR